MSLNNWKNIIILFSVVVMLFITSFYAHLFERIVKPLAPLWTASERIDNSKLLKELGLLPVYKTSSDSQTYRLTISDGFGRANIVNLDVSSEQAIASVKRFKAKNQSSKEVELISEIIKPLTYTDIESFYDKAANSEFLLRKPKETYQDGPDGWTWKVEAMSDNKYIYAESWGPSSREVKAFGDALIDLVGSEAIKLRDMGYN